MNITVPNPLSTAPPSSESVGQAAVKRKWSTRKKIAIFSGFGCLGSALILYTIFALAVKVVDRRASKFPTASNTNDSRSSKITTDENAQVPQQGSIRKDVTTVVVASNIVVESLNSEIDSGTHPSVALVKSLEILHDLQISNDFARCPPDIREALVRFLTTMELLKSEADTLPKTPEQGLAQGMVNGLNGEVDGGQGRVDRSWRSRVSAVQEAQGNLNAVAQKYLSK